VTEHPVPTLVNLHRDRHRVSELTHGFAGIGTGEGSGSYGGGCGVLSSFLLDVAHPAKMSPKQMVRLSPPTAQPWVIHVKRLQRFGGDVIGGMVTLCSPATLEVKCLQHLKRMSFEGSVLLLSPQRKSFGCRDDARKPRNRCRMLRCSVTGQPLPDAPMLRNRTAVAGCSDARTPDQHIIKFFIYILFIYICN
jgi:hypothetical protein